jgi:hypothetical protein
LNNNFIKREKKRRVERRRDEMRRGDFSSFSKN